MYIILLLFIILLLHQFYIKIKEVDYLKHNRDYYKTKYNKCKEELCSKN